MAKPRLADFYSDRSSYFRSDARKRSGFGRRRHSHRPAFLVQEFLGNPPFDLFSPGRALLGVQSTTPQAIIKEVGRDITKPLPLLERECRFDFQRCKIPIYLVVVHTARRRFQVVPSRQNAQDTREEP